jgi:hypothetical protein
MLILLRLGAMRLAFPAASNSHIPMHRLVDSVLSTFFISQRRQEWYNSHKYRERNKLEWPLKPPKMELWKPAKNNNN